MLIKKTPEVSEEKFCVASGERKFNIAQLFYHSAGNIFFLANQILQIHKHSKWQQTTSTSTWKNLKSIENSRFTITNKILQWHKIQNK